MKMFGAAGCQSGSWRVWENDAASLCPTASEKNLHQCLSCSFPSKLKNSFEEGRKKKKILLSFSTQAFGKKVMYVARDCSYSNASCFSKQLYKILLCLAAMAGMQESSVIFCENDCRVKLPTVSCLCLYQTDERGEEVVPQLSIPHFLALSLLASDPQWSVCKTNREEAMQLFGWLLILLLLGTLRATAFQGKDFIHMALALVIIQIAKLTSGQVRLSVVSLSCLYCKSKYLKKKTGYKTM